MASRADGNGPLFKRMAIAMAISVPLSVVITLAMMTWVFGTDPDAVIPVSLGYKFGLCMAILGPVLLGPLASYRTHLAIRQRDRAQIQLRRLAETDQLTGLPNRHGIDAAGNDALQCDSQPLSVLMIDVDFFKSINDRFGHDFGDAALVQVASQLRSFATLHRSIFGRQGGEEFIGLLPGMEAGDAIGVAEQLREAIAASPIAFAGHVTAVTVSIGISSRRSRATSLSQLISEADKALYSAKSGGRNCVVPYRCSATLPCIVGTPLAPDDGERATDGEPAPFPASAQREK